MTLFELRAILDDPYGTNTLCMGYFTSLQIARSYISVLEKEQKYTDIPHKFLLIPHLLKGVVLSDNRIFETKVVFHSRQYSDSESYCLGIFENRDKARCCAETFRKLLDPEFSKELICTVSISEHRLNDCRTVDGSKPLKKSI